ncbi:hypothetical protein ACFQ9V_14715 [Leifsonia sp. NPDC056665]|uniref:hypothetical protein n=1 Tax=Leifsonia sp. NPDC056665 TaxID=3345901 RepID=UPI0036875910
MTDVTSALPPDTDRFAWVRKLLPRIVVGSLIAAALVGVYAVIIGTWDETCWRLIGTIALLVFFSLVSWYDADVSARRAPWFGAVSVILSAFLLLDGLVKIWSPAFDGSSSTEGSPGTSSWGFVGWIALVVVVRLGLLHIHLVLNTQRRFTGPIMSKVTVCTLVLVGALTLGLAAPLVFDHTTFSDTYWRLVATIAILDALGTILIPLTYTLFGPKAEKGARSAGVVPPVVGPVGYAPPVATASYAPPAAPPAAATPSSPYPNVLTPVGGYRLEWPRYVNGTPLPARQDGAPDFTGVIGY